MQRRQDEDEPSDRPDHYREGPKWVEAALIFISASLVSWPTVLIFNSVLQRKAPWLLSYGGASYVLAFATVLLIGPINLLPKWLLTRIIRYACVFLVVIPPMLGSITIIYALVELTGNHRDRADFVFVLSLYALVEYLLIMLGRRAARAHRSATP